ncbi:hypothetical protein HN51_059483 [Arachis hypogaea]|uniref:Uncharacterized protein n=1 Tax=Arachis hypogaea TaxID=3818 RepID=A0A444X5R4_ARAHY|nr:uncharacterized protein LOC107623791 [Arachis ipaensis]XP_025681950.1 uncharacterized protein LOC112783285 [Arachis hypogaea]QHN82894.1 uncharacterized protein DS421_20g699790 [Arachis hypogaea]RYQ85036.1 hypothetical protein Ahy_B10g104530 [Arachis hypogaea]
MAGVAVLNPQDCLPTSRPRKPITSPSSSSSPKIPSPSPKSSRSSRTNPNRQKKSQIRPDTKQPIMVRFTILKRGEPLPQTTQLPKTEKTTSDAVAVRPKELIGGTYAGSCVASPPPSSVPLPIFVTKKIAAVSEATNELRKMLRLEFS